MRNTTTSDSLEVIAARQARGETWAVERRFADGRVDHMIDPSPNDHYRAVYAPLVVSVRWQKVTFR
jgi:hypothetical protein